MRRGGTGAALLVLLLISCSWGYTFLDLGMGSEVFRGSARCGGMGQISLLCEESPRAVAINPATLAALKAPEITVSYRFFAPEEDWSFPVHDSFDALLGYDTYSRNFDIYQDLDIGFASGVIPEAFGASFGFAILPAYDFRYNFYEEVRDRSTSSVPSDRIIAESFIEGDGVVRSLSLGIARSFDIGLALGASVDYLFGDYDLEARLCDVDTTQLRWEIAKTETSDTFSASNLDGARYRLGVTYTLTKRLKVAASVTSACELEGNYLSSSTEGLLRFLPRRDVKGKGFKVKYPASYSLGIAFRPRNELLTVIEADVRHTKWSDAENQALEAFRLDDTYEWHIGVEHVFYNGRPLRFGFSYQPSPADKETSEAAVTVGSGIDVQGFTVDFSLKVGWREYRHFDLFDDSTFGAKSREFTDLVEETSVSGVISVHRRF